jgi:hypothetical protein
LKVSKHSRLRLPPHSISALHRQSPTSAPSMTSTALNNTAEPLYTLHALDARL